MRLFFSVSRRHKNIFGALQAYNIMCVCVCIYSFGIRSVIPSLYLFRILHISTWTDFQCDYNFNFLSLFQKSAYRLCHIKRCLSRLLIIHFCGSVEHVGNRFLIGGITFIAILHRGHCAHIVQLRTVVLIRYEITSVGSIETCFSSLSINVCVWAAIQLPVLTQSLILKYVSCTYLCVCLGGGCATTCLQEAVTVLLKCNICVVWDSAIMSPKKKIVGWLQDI